MQKMVCRYGGPTEWEQSNYSLKNVKIFCGTKKKQYFNVCLYEKNFFGRNYKDSNDNLS